MVLGCCGAGKSTFARALSSIIGVEVIHLDQYYWKPEWTETVKSEWEKTVANLAKREEWIIDGNYGGTMDVRIERADTIILLDYSTVKCLWRVVKRIARYRGKVRPDMPDGCRERFDLEFLHYTATYNIRKRKKTLRKLSVLKSHKTIHIFKDDNESNQFLNSLKL